MIEKYIEHTNLNPEATREDIERLVAEAQEYNFRAICVNPYYVGYARNLLGFDSPIKIATVIGFPLGAETTSSKAFAGIEAIRCGADELDVVINIGALKDKDYMVVVTDLEVLRRSIREEHPIKAIIETALLTEEEKKKACEIAFKAGVDYVKTSTGFSKSGARVEDVQLIRQEVKDKLSIKASGGIRDLETAQALLEAGADSLGCSQGVSLVHAERELNQRG